ncbi:MAG: hypothetical protein RLY86_625 [Pseudomonadota bacterium]|jgi:asparagine synthetase B (glutamine-hydrolysing)
MTPVLALTLDRGAVIPAIPADWADRVQVTPDAVRVSGCPVGSHPIYTHVGGDGVLRLARSAGPLLEAAAALGQSIRLSPTGLTFLLGYCLTPFPFTVFEGVAVLGIGDTLTIPRDGSDRGIHGCDFPYLRALSQQDREPDPAHLHRLVLNAVARSLPQGERGLLMLSSGKDSTGLLMALADVAPGRAAAVTFGEGPASAAEAEFAAALCRKLGVPHRTVLCDQAPALFRERMVQAFTDAPEPSLDLTHVPYVMAVAQGGEVGATHLFDGTGCDVYCGYVPRSRDRIADLSPLAGTWIGRVIQPFLLSESRVNNLIFSRAENSLFGPKMRLHDMAALMVPDPGAPAHLRTISRAGRHLDGSDFRTMMVRHFDGRRVMQKARLTAPAWGMQATFPYADPALAEYVFNLPEPWRFTERPRRNKVLWREMLSRFADYDADRVGKRIFDFDPRPVLRRHRDFITGEILDCPVWDRRGGEAFVTAAYDTLDSAGHAPHRLTRLFLLSGWINHSRYLRPR